MILPHVAVVLNWRNETNKSGLYPVHLRITINRVSQYYKIDVPKKIRLAEWSGTDDAWVKQSHEFSFEINNQIRDKKNIVHDLIKRHYSFNKNLHFDTIFLHLDKKGDRNSFHDYMDEYIKKPPEKLEEVTLKKYRTAVKHLRAFRKQVYFSDIDSLMVKDFHRYMQVDLKLEGAACKKYMEAFKKVVRHARKENFISPAQLEFLFDEVKITVKKPKRTYLEPHEIKAWKDYKFEKDQHFLERDRDIFLLQIYTGYYYKDLLIFMKEQLLDDEKYGYIIKGARDKNGNETLIPLFKFPHAAKIIKKYAPLEKDKTVIDPKYLIEEPAYNRNLKEIAALPAHQRPAFDTIWGQGRNSRQNDGTYQ